MTKKSIQNKILEAKKVIKELEKKEKLKNKNTTDKIINILGSIIMKEVLKNNDTAKLKELVDLCSSKDQDFIKNNISLFNLNMELK